MRMWMVDPRIMCRKHLLGEHVETHMFLSCVARGKNLDGYINGNLFEIGSLINRHSALAFEMTKRGYNHKSHIGIISFQLQDKFKNYKNVKIDADKSLQDLLSRCPECRKRYEERKHING